MEELRMTVKEMAELCGVSARTLHYYDQIGLLRPAEVAENGYRRYGRAEAERLQQILFYRELDFSLGEIRDILASPDYDAKKALVRQRELLTLKRERLDRLLRVLDANLRGEATMDFTGFDTSDIDRARREYAAEAEARWGGSDAWRESREREARRGPDQEAALAEEMNGIFRRIAALAKGDPAGAEAQAAVAEWQAFITKHYYACSDETLAGLGELYTADGRFRENLNKFGAGTAEFLAAAIRARSPRGESGS